MSKLKFFGVCLHIFGSIFIKTSVYASDISVYNQKGVCTEGYFQCVNDTLCVPQNNQCNGNLDCPSGSDEINCDDSHDDDYWDHLYRKRPAAEHDDLDETCQLSYTGSCVCRSRDILCHYKKYQSAPNDLPKEYIDILDFTGSNFKVLRPETVANIHNDVNKLSLIHCNIDELQPEAFHLLTSIKYLHLDNNNIKHIPANIFAKNNKLMTLSLMYNDISTINDRAFIELKYLIELDLRGNKLQKVHSKAFEKLESLTILYLQNNQIKYVETSSFPRLSLRQLSLTDNKITVLAKGAFGNLHELRSLFISNNNVRELRNGTFAKLTVLESLTLNDNFIGKIDTTVFHDVPNLNSLRLERNQFRELEKDILLPLKKLQNIYFDRFELCSSATHVRVCHPQGDGISSQEHLLANPILRTCVWVMAAIGCTGNLVVLLGRMLSPTNNVVHSLYLRNLALSDLLMGIYLFIIASKDLVYRDVYLRYQFQWRHSYVCSLCGFLSTLSCESSVLILCLVTWDRFVSVTQPLARKQPSPRTAALTLLALWCLAAIVSLAPLSSFTKGYFGEEFYGNNGVCLSLHIHEPYAMGWEYSTIMFVLLNTMALIFISYAYLRMVQEIKASGVACRSTRQSQDRDKVAQRFGIIVFTDCMCWVPVIVVKLVAIAGWPIPPDLYAWLAIFVLPINSALNPVLYTMMTTVFKKQVRKIINDCVRKTRKENQHSASESGFSLSFGAFPKSNPRRILSYNRETQSSMTASKNSGKRSATAV